MSLSVSGEEFVLLRRGPGHQVARVLERGHNPRTGGLRWRCSRWDHARRRWVRERWYGEGDVDGSPAPEDHRLPFALASLRRREAV